MLDKVIEYLAEIELPYLKGEKDSITFTAKMYNASFHCVLEINEKFSVILFYSIINVVVPDAKRNVLAELLTRINNELVIGNFEMDYDDGEVRCRTSFDFEGGELTTSLVENLVESNLMVADAHIYSIMKAVVSDLSPAEILKEKDVNIGANG